MCDSLLKKYKDEVSKIQGALDPNTGNWSDFHDWYKSSCGRRLFIDAFQQFTDININLQRDFNSRVEIGVPKSPNDYKKKRNSCIYYGVMAEMFIEELDCIVQRALQVTDDKFVQTNFAIVQGFIQSLLHDSLCLFSDWDHYCNDDSQESFVAWRAPYTHSQYFFWGAKQVIYGHGIFDSTYIDNHAELALPLVRQGIEVRLRYAFGLVGKESINDGSIHPVALSNLLDVLNQYREDVYFAIPIQNVHRIYKWSTIVLHTGLRDYYWVPPRLLDYLYPFIVGYESVNNITTVNSGVRLKRSCFNAIRTDLKTKIESTHKTGTNKFRALLMNATDCSVAFTDN